MRLSDAGLRQRPTTLIYSNHRPPPWFIEDATPRSLEPLIRPWRNVQQNQRPLRSCTTTDAPCENPQPDHRRYRNKEKTRRCTGCKKLIGTRTRTAAAANTNVLQWQRHPIDDHARNGETNSGPNNAGKNWSRCTRPRKSIDNRYYYRRQKNCSELN
jgi:hypothetical protein